MANSRVNSNEPPGWHVAVLGLLESIDRKMGAAVTTPQQDIDAATAEFTQVLSDIQAQGAQLVTDLTAIQNIITGGSTVSTTALDGVVASAQAIQAGLDTAVANVTSLVIPPAPAASAGPAVQQFDAQGNKTG